VSHAWEESFPTTDGADGSAFEIPSEATRYFTLGSEVFLPVQVIGGLLGAPSRRPAPLSAALEYLHGQFERLGWSQEMPVAELIKVRNVRLHEQGRNRASDDDHVAEAARKAVRRFILRAPHVPSAELLVELCRALRCAIPPDLRVGTLERQFAAAVYWYGDALKLTHDDDLLALAGEGLDPRVADLLLPKVVARRDESPACDRPVVGSWRSRSAPVRRRRTKDEGPRTARPVITSSLVAAVGPRHA
jgi:hypothetical protein